MSKSNKKFITIHIIDGVKGDYLTINDQRVADSKPWGGGRIKNEFTVSVEDLKSIIGQAECHT